MPSPRPPSSRLSTVPAIPVLPSRSAAAWFWLRIRLLTAQRIAQDAVNPRLRRWASVPVAGSALQQAPVAGQCQSDLWTDGRADEFVLVAGKVENLRRAVRAFDGLEVPAGGILSFWHQLGRATAGRGFVLGREVRAGCVVPAIAGGICQLSNALATAAQRAGLQLLERHGHTAQIEAGHAQTGTVDATVLWKHIDLRIASQQPWRLEVAMDAQTLVVRIRVQGAAGKGVEAAVAPRPRHFPLPVVRAESTKEVRGCLTCDETSCFRHQPHLAAMAEGASTHAALLEGLTPELAAYLAQRGTNEPPMQVVLPQAVTTGQRLQVAAQRLPASYQAVSPGIWGTLAAVRRALWLRWNSQTPGKRQASMVQAEAWQASLAARQLRVTDTAVLVDQAYLPSLWQAGALAGRRFAVWMPAMPMQGIVQQLDQAAAQWPDEPSLADFRPNDEMQAAEQQALAAAERIVTPHHAVADWARAQLRVPVDVVAWQMPAAQKRERNVPHATPPLVVMLCSALPRKGSRELAAALQQLRAQGLPYRVAVLGSLPGAAADVHWQEIERISMRYGDDWPAEAAVAVLPAHVEHSPRAALLALACGVPLVATSACGLPAQPGLAIVPAGNVAALAQAIATALGAQGAQAVA